MLKLLKNKQNVFLMLGFIFINMIIIVSTSDIFEKIQLIYSRTALESQFQILDSDENINFGEVARDLKNTNIYAFLNYPQFQFIDDSFLALSFLATNSKDLKSLKFLKIEGNDFSEEDINLGSKKIIIPKKFERFTTEKNGKKMFYIERLGHWFEVIGFIESAGLYNNIIIPYKNLDNITNKEYAMMVSKEIRTSKYSFQPIERPKFISIVNDVIESQKESVISMVLGIVMALSTLIIFNIIWINENKVKFKIFKTVGFSNKNLLEYVFKNIGKLGILGLLATIILSLFVPLIRPMTTPVIGIPIILTCCIFVLIITLIVTISSLKQILLFIDIKE